MLLGILFSLLFFSSAARASEQWVHLDGVSEGTVVNTLYQDVVFVGIGDGGPFDVIASLPCGEAASAPHVFSFRDQGECPEFNTLDGWIEADFAVEQPWVSVQAIHSDAGTVAYLKAYAGPSESDLLDQKISSFGAEWVGVAQTLRIQREPTERQITRISFGSINLDANRAGFDDLRYPLIEVSVSATSWSALRARFKPSPFHYGRALQESVAPSRSVRAVA